MRLALVVFVLAFAAACGTAPDRSLVAEEGAFRIPLQTLSDGKARHYTVAAGGKEITFFVVRSPDGVVRAAFDACDVCFRSGKGYVQEGEHMVCVECGQRFHVSRINVLEGGCNPAPLNRSVEGDMLILMEQDVAKGAVYFSSGEPL
jgi:uncharacterized membrane protein